MESRVKPSGVVLVVAALAVSSCERDEVPPKTRLDAQQAIAAAAAAIPGSPQGVRLETRGGRAEYEVTIAPKDGGPRVRVEVDANSGQVLKSDPPTGRDRDDDD